MRKIISILMLCISAYAYAESPVIVDAQARLKSNQLYDIAVTLEHPDTGWDHYANEWVVEVDGEIVGTRTLHHPHVNEQPFTRSLRDVRIPADATSVKVYAKCNLDDRSKAFSLKE